MTSLYDMYETDPNLERDGVWYQFSPKIKFLLARAGGANVKFSKVTEAKFMPHRRQLENKTIDTDLMQDLMKEIFAETVILDWVGVTDKAGKKIPCNKQNILKLFKDLPDLYKEIEDEATRLAHYLLKQVDDDSGN